QQQTSLLFYGYESSAVTLDLFLHHRFLPEEVRKQLAHLVPNQEKHRLSGLEDAPEAAEIDGVYFNLIRADTERPGLHDLRVYRRLVDQGRLKYSTTSSRLTPKSVKTLMQNLLEADFIYHEGAPRIKDTIRPFGLDVFARESQLVSGKVATLTDSGRAFLNGDMEALLTAFEQWVDHGSFDEFSRVVAVKGQKARQTRLTDPRTRREKVIEALSWCPVGVWISLDDFFRAVKIWHFDFEIDASEFTGLYIDHPEYGWLGNAGPGSWMVTTALYISALIFEYLGSIGAVDLLYVPADEFGLLIPYLEHDEEYYSLYDGLLYFRINLLGAFLLGHADDYVPPTAQVTSLFEIDANLELTLTGKESLTPDLGHQLEQLTSPVQAGRYRLDTRKTVEVLAQGLDAGQILAFFQQYNEGPLPKAVSSWLADLEAKRGSLTVREQAVIIKVRAPAAMQVIKNDRQLSQAVTLLDDTTIVLPATRTRTFHQRLKEHGYHIEGIT
ncbi:MAG: helicase-associated domain-containing protein, partial [Trueperaceae bacterium]